MPKYLYLLRNEGECVSEAMSPEEMQQTLEQYMAWVNKLKETDRLVAADKLVDGNGRVVSKAKGTIKDGPFSESKEVVGGFWVVKARDYEDAMTTAVELPYGSGTLEIREIEEHEV